MAHDGAQGFRAATGSKPKRPALSSTRQIAEHFRDTLRECGVAPLSIFAHLDFMKNARNKGRRFSKTQVKRLCAPNGGPVDFVGIILEHSDLFAFSECKKLVFLPGTTPDTAPQPSAKVCSSFRQLGFCREYATCPMSHSIDALPATMDPTCAVLRRRHTLRNRKCDLQRGDAMLKYSCYHCPYTVPQIRARPWKQLTEHMKRTHPHLPVMSLSLCRKECTQEEAELFWSQLELDEKGVPGEATSEDEEEFASDQEPESLHQGEDMEEFASDQEPESLRQGEDKEEFASDQEPESLRQGEAKEELAPKQELESPHQGVDDYDESAEKQEQHVSDWASSTLLVGEEDDAHERREEVMQEMQLDGQLQEEHRQSNDLDDKAYWDDWGDAEVSTDNQREANVRDEDSCAAEAYDSELQGREEQERHLEIHRERRAQLTSAGSAVNAQRQHLYKSSSDNNTQFRNDVKLVSIADRALLTQHRSAPKPAIIASQTGVVRPLPQVSSATQQQLWHQHAQQQRHVSAERQTAARLELHKLRAATQNFSSHLEPHTGGRHEEQSAFHVAGSTFGATAVRPLSAVPVGFSKRQREPFPEAPCVGQRPDDCGNWDCGAPKRKSVLGRSTTGIPRWP